MDELGLISLFCGPGGLDEGFMQAGFVPRLAYDIDKASVVTYNHNHHGHGSAKQADLSKVDAKDIVLDWKKLGFPPPVGVIGGPPCQSFSVSNVRQKEVHLYHELPEHYARILDGLNKVFGLSFFVFENVPGLVTKRHKHRFKRFIELFEQAGFHTFEGCLDAKNFGVAQVRSRVFVVGLNKEQFSGTEFTFPIGGGGIKTVREEIGSLPEPTYFARNLTEEDIRYHPNHWCMVPRSRKFQDGALKPGQIGGRSFRVLDWDRPSYTVAYGHREVHVHPNCKRRLSVYEAMRLQGFPHRYVLKGTLSDQIRLVSEAVSPQVAEALAQALQKQLGLKKSTSEA